LLRCLKDKPIHRPRNYCFLMVAQSPLLCQDRDLTGSVKKSV